LSQISTGQAGLANESIRKAFALRKHVSEWEKFAIESRYDLAVMGNLQKARHVYQLWAQIYPRQGIPASVLSEDVDPAIALYQDALADAREAVARDPQNPEYYEGLAASYIYLDRLDEARAIAGEAARKRLESSDLPQQMYHLGFIAGDRALMARELAWAAGKPNSEDVLLSYEADTAAFAGQMGKSRRLSEQAITSALQVDEKEAAAAFRSEWAVREGVFGDFDEARRQARAALAESSARDVEARAVFALALAGDPVDHMMEDLARRFPEDTTVQFIFLPVIRAQLALNRHEATRAIHELDPSSPFDLASASPEQIIPFALYPCFLRGNAFLANQQPAQAAVEYQKILDHPGIVVNELIGALAVKNLALAYAQVGQNDKSAATYRQFISLWHEADEGNAVSREASLELSKLQGGQTAGSEQTK
jgi:eukaryotic-like serine/threonine-protein kinase